MKVIYVDDEQHAISKFVLLAKSISNIEDLKTFDNPISAIEYTKKANVNVAFLDIELPTMNGISLAKELKKINKNIRIVFITAYNTYSLDAFDVDAVGYLLKPYTLEKLKNVFERVQLIRDIPTKKVVIKTFGGFDVYVDGELLLFSRQKPKELLALLIDKHGSKVTSGLAISYLWENRENDISTGGLYRMTGKRLREILEAKGIDFILNDGYKCVNVDTFECDYYNFLNNKKGSLNNYNEDYMPEYYWAEETNAKIYNCKMNKNNKF